MPRKMTQAEWDSMDFGSYVSLKEGQKACIKFLTGFWLYQKGEENPIGDEVRWNQWLAEINIVPNEERKLLIGQLGLRRALKKEMAIRNISLDDLENKQPIFTIQRDSMYDWTVRFEGFAGSRKSAKPRSDLSRDLPQRKVADIQMEIESMVRANGGEASLSDVRNIIRNVFKITSEQFDKVARNMRRIEVRQDRLIYKKDNMTDVGSGEDEIEFDDTELDDNKGEE